MRVITGTAKGRRLEAPAGLDTRPTSERTKEAMFSIIQFEIEQASVLDLFAGSGQLGIEALSRGAGSALALDLNPAAIASLRSHLHTLQCENGQLLQTDALLYLQNPAATPFDLVFLDPPFSQNLLLPACTLLEQNGWLAADAWVYTESENPPSSLGMPGNWRLHREQKAGQVYYALWQRTT